MSNHHSEELLNLPRVYENTPIEDLNSILDALVDLTNALEIYETRAEKLFSNSYTRGMTSMDFLMKHNHDRPISKALAQALAELALRTHLEGKSVSAFLSEQDSVLFYRFDRTDVIDIVQKWANDLS